MYSLGWCSIVYGNNSRNHDLVVECWGGVNGKDALDRRASCCGCSRGCVPRWIFRCGVALIRVWVVNTLLLLMMIVLMDMVEVEVCASIQ